MNCTNDIENHKRAFKDCDKFSPSIRKLIIDWIQEFPGLYKSKEDVLNHMLLGYGTGCEWVKGSIKYNGHYKYGKKEMPMSRRLAEEIYMYGYQRKFTIYGHFAKEYSPLFNIPKNVSKSWVEVIKSFLYTINNIDSKAYKIELLAYHIRAYGINNPNCYSWFGRCWEEFNELRKYTNQSAKDMGMEWMSVDSLQNPKKKVDRAVKMKKMIDDILNQADEIIPKAKHQILKRDAEEYVKRYGKDIFKEIISEMEK